MLFAICAQSHLPSPNDMVAQIKLSLILRRDVIAVGTEEWGYMFHTYFKFSIFLFLFLLQKQFKEDRYQSSLKCLDQDLSRQISRNCVSW